MSAPGGDQLPDDLRRQVADELNVQSLESLTDAAGDLIEVSVKPNFRSLGRTHGKQTPQVAAAITALDPVGVVAQLRGPDGSASVHVDTLGPVTITADDVVVTETPREGWAVASAEGATVARPAPDTVAGTARIGAPGDPRRAGGPQGVRLLRSVIA